MVVIGAGPAGLAAAAALGQQGVSATVLEQTSVVGDRWRRHYRRLHLHTIKRYSGLPGMPWPSDAPRYPSRAAVVDYLEAYARQFQIQPRFGVTVTQAEPGGVGWRLSLRTPDGDEVLEAQNLIVATGYNRVPVYPEIPGLESFTGTARHSGEYLDGAYARGQRALVVGCGNSGAEIALDLLEHGAKVGLVVRSPTWVLPRDLLGRPSQATSILLSRLPNSLADAIAVATLRLSVGDLSAWGIQRPAKAPRAMIHDHGRVPMLDIGTLGAIKSGQIQVWPGVERIDGPQLRFADGRAADFDHLVLATGFRAGLDDFLKADYPRSPRGLPALHGQEAGVPGLFFIGMNNVPTGALREMALEAPRLAAAVKARLDQSSSSAAQPAG